jgi:serine/threonine-protein kinase
MGRVEIALRAGDPDGEVFVIKRMHSEGRSEDQEARFRREVQIAARLDDANIARTFGVEDIDGEPCLAQEFVHGVDLGGIMRQLRPRTIPIAAAVHVAREVCRGLDYAHDFGGEGIVHRDVTPENIMISFAGDVKLIDFGIARSAVDGTLTNVGVIIGRREYIAPESWEGEKADRRVDVYALGVVLWELLTGRRLEGSTEIGPGKRPPDPATVNPSVPAPLGEIVARALAETPESRFQTAEEFRVALAPFGLPEVGAKEELVAILRANFQVDLMRDLLAEDVAEARSFLAPEASPTTPEPSAPGRPSRLRGPLVAVGMAAVVLIVGITLFARPRDIAPAPRISSGVPMSSDIPSAPASTPAAAVKPRPGMPTGGNALPQTAALPVARNERHGRRTAPIPVSTPGALDAPSGEELVHEAQGEWDRGNDAAALVLLRQVKGPNSGAPARVLAGAILIGEGKLPEAEKELTEALRVDTENPRAKKLLAMAREKMERQ